MSTTKVKYNAPLANIARVVLSDKSIAYNVIATLDGHQFILGCVTARHATELAIAINQTAWVEKALSC